MLNENIYTLRWLLYSRRMLYDKGGLQVEKVDMGRCFSLKRIILLCESVLCALFLFGAPSCADTFWEKYWNPGEYIIEITPEEDTRFTYIIKEAIQRSEGTNIRFGADRESDIESAYKNFLNISPDGTPMEPTDSIIYEDIGYYCWAVGIPDEQSISKEEAWKRCLKLLIEESVFTEEALVHYYPQMTYETGNDSENPVWIIVLMCYDYKESKLPIMGPEVAVYAHDGSICGYRNAN